MILITTLVYERLDKHCTKCLRLDHELKECLVARAEKKALLALQEEENDNLPRQVDQGADSRRGLSANSAYNDPNGNGKERQSKTPFQFSANNDRNDSVKRTTRDHVGSHSHRDYKLQTKAWEDRTSQRRHNQAKERSRSSYDRHAFSHRGTSSHHYNNAPPRKSYYREIPRVPSGPNNSVSSPSHHHDHSLRGNPREKEKEKGQVHEAAIVIADIPHEIMADARIEARDALMQYTKCTDPSEREARLERAKRAEDQGHLEKTAVNIARRTSKSSTEIHQEEQGQGPLERSHISERLGQGTHQANVDVNLPGQSSDTRSRLPATLRLGPLQATTSGDHERSPARLPVSQWLGPIGGPEAVGKQPAQAGEKCKPGRPTGSRSVKEKASGKVPTLPIRRKTVSQNKQSPLRRNASPKEGAMSKTTKTSKSKKGDTSRPAKKQAPENTSSENAPIINLIPRKPTRFTGLTCGFLDDGYHKATQEVAYANYTKRLHREHIVESTSKHSLEPWLQANQLARDLGPS
ncbi:hypothetical protein Bca4012_056813 [Brassica carinata]